MKDTLKKTNEILRKYGITANKRFGQNFLIDDYILENIIDSSNISKDDLVIEIGPGLGNLTEYLLQEANHVLLIEIDKNMIEIINDRFSNSINYTLINEDVLKVSIDEKISEIENKNNIKFKNIKVVANLPYYITTPILFKLLQDENRIGEITVMVQKEVALRMVANEKSKDYGILTLMTKFLSVPEIVVNVPNTSFIPAPNVESAVIKLIKEKRYEVRNEELFIKLVHSSFATRRKKMINSLMNTHFLNMEKSQIEEVFNKCNIDLNTRAEQLKIEEFIKIADEIENI